MNTDQWQAIETAPRDGTAILVSDGDRMQVCWWGYDDLFDLEPKEWCYGECRGEYNIYQTFDCPTHWQPLPGPPKIS